MIKLLKKIILDREIYSRGLRNLFLFCLSDDKQDEPVIQDKPVKQDEPVRRDEPVGQVEPVRWYKPITNQIRVVAFNVPQLT